MLYLVPKASNMLLCIDGNSGDIQYKEWMLTQNTYNHIKDFTLLGERIVNEAEVPLVFFIKWI